MHMFRKRLVVLSLVAMILPTVALADNSGWYLAVDGGQAHFSGTDSQFPQSYANPPNASGDGILINSTSTVSHQENRDTGYRLMVGYQFNPYWGVEASYVDLGTATAKGTANGTAAPYCPSTDSCPPYVGLASFGYKASTSDRGPGLAFTGTYPINSQWSVFARAGMIDARVKLDLETSPIPEPYATTLPADTSRSSTGWSDTFGLGVNWALNNRWAVRLGWDRYADLGSRNRTGSNSVNLASLGLVYHI
jgi:OOP family OmpA-OmpF porin